VSRNELKNKTLIISVISIAIVLMASSIPLLQASTEYMHVYLWNNTNKERYADGRIRIYKGSQPSVIGGHQVWRNKLFDSDNELGHGRTTSSISWYGAESNETYTVRANSTKWGGEVSKVVTGGGVVELFFDLATEPSDIPDEIPEEPTETPEEPPVDNSIPENDSGTELDDFTQVLLILVIAVVVIVVIVVVYRMAKTKTSRGSTDYRQTAS